MSRSGLLLVLALGVAAVLWFLMGVQTDPSDAPRPLEESAPTAGREASVAGAPQLERSEGAPARKTLWVGKGGLVGTVRRDGRPLAALVEVRQTLALDPDRAQGGAQWRGLFSRMLDMGLSAGSTARTLRTAADGTYEVEDLAPGVYEILATAEGSSGNALATLPTRGARVQVDVDLGSGGLALKGRVLDAEGKPLAGAVVVASSPEFSPLGGIGRIGVPSNLDPEGRFELTGLSPGTIGVSALLLGRMHVRGPPVTLPSDEEYVLKVPAGTRMLRGRVLETGSDAPISGALVMGGAGDPRTVLVISATRSDAEGRFQMDMPPGEGGMFVEAQGYASTVVQMRGASSEDELIVRLSTLAVLHGTVRAKGTGAPVAGIYVSAVPVGRERVMSLPDGGLSDAEGRYRLSQVPPGEVNLSAIGVGYASAGMAEAQSGGFNPLARTVAPGAEMQVDLEVEPAARVRGRLRTADGQPVVGAVVTPSQVAMLGMMGRGGMDTARGAGVSDESGQYTIEALLPGTTASLTAQAAGLPQAKSESFECVGGQTHEVDLVFPAVRALAVRVVRAADGQAVAGASVRVSREGEHGWQQVLGSWTTGAEGRVRIEPVPEGAIGVWAEAPDCVKEQQPREVAMAADAAGEAQYELRLEAGLVIGGRVVLPDGVPASALRITISTEHVGGPRTRHIWERTAAAEDGTFRLAVFPPGDYRVVASGQWEDVPYSASAVVRAGEADLTLKVERGGGGPEDFVLYVLDSKGKPVSEGFATLHHASADGASRGSSGTSLRGGSTTFRSQPAPDGTQWLEVRGVPGHGSALFGPFPASQRELRVTLEAERLIQGVVVGPDGPIQGVRVAAFALLPTQQRSSGHGHGNEHASVHSGEAGGFVLTSLGDLEYELLFAVPPEFVLPKPLTVRGGARGVRVELVRGLRAQVRVLDYAGQPVAGATLSVTPETQAESDDAPLREVRSPTSGRANWRTGADGTATLEGLDRTATLKLSVEPPSSRQDLLPRQLSAWAPRDETIRLDRAYEIMGRVVDEHGRPVRSGSVYAERIVPGAARQTSFAQAQIQLDGTFRIRNIVEGTYQLRAQPAGTQLDLRAQEAQPGSRFAAGSRDVTLRVEVGGLLDVSLGGVQLQRHWAQAWVRPESGAGNAQHVRVNEDGRIYCAGLDPAQTYTVFVYGLPDGLYALEAGLKPDGRPRTVVPREGTWLTVRVEGAAPGRNVHAQVDLLPGVSVGMRRANDSAVHRIDGIPSGTWRVTARYHDAQAPMDGSAEISTGEEGLIVLRASAR